MVQSLLAVVAVIGLLSGRIPGRGQSLQVSLMLIGAASAAASLVVFAWRVCAEARQTRRPWQGTALFNHAVLSCLLIVGLVATPLIGRVLDYRLTWLARPTRIEALLWSCVLVGIEATRIAFISRLLRQGRDLPGGTTELYSLAIWSQRRLGRWWLPEVAGLAFVCLGVILPQPLSTQSPQFSVLLGLIFGSDRQLPRLVLQERGFCLLWQDEERAALVQRRELEQSPEYKALKARNESIEVWSSIAAIAGIMLPLLVILQLHLFGNDNAGNLWVCSLMFGFPLSAAPAVALAATLPRGRARWHDLRTYYSLKYRDPGCRMASYLVLGSALLTAVSATGVRLSLLHRT